MSTKFPHLIAALQEALAAVPDNASLRAQLNDLLVERAPAGEFRGLRLVAPALDPENAPAGLLAAR